MSKKAENNNEDAIEKLGKFLGKDSNVIEQAREMEKRVNSLLEDGKFFKTMVKNADALRATMARLEDVYGESLPTNQLVNFMSGTLVILEEEGLIKITVGKDKKK